LRLGHPVTIPTRSNEGRVFITAMTTISSSITMTTSIMTTIITTTMAMTNDDDNRRPHGSGHS